jgi:hypothetical protein
MVEADISLYPNLFSKRLTIAAQRSAAKSVPDDWRNNPPSLTRHPLRARLMEERLTRKDGAMEMRKCPTLVNGKECGFELILVDEDSETEIGTYECPLGHRTHVLLGAREKRNCPALVDGSRVCGLALLIVERDLDTATAIYECPLGHRTYVPLEPEAVNGS